MKIVINKCYGGFGISKAAAQYMADRGHAAAIESLKEKEYYGYFCRADKERTDPLLVEAVEVLGIKAASGMCGELVVVEIPDGMAYEITEYDGYESIEAPRNIYG